MTVATGSTQPRTLDNLLARNTPILSDGQLEALSKLLPPGCQITRDPGAGARASRYVAISTEYDTITHPAASIDSALAALYDLLDLEPDEALTTNVMLLELTGPTTTVLNQALGALQIKPQTVQLRSYTPQREPDRYPDRYPDDELKMRGLPF